MSTEKRALEQLFAAMVAKLEIDKRFVVDPHWKKPQAAELSPKAKLMLMRAAVALLVRNSSFADRASPEVPVALEQASPPEEAA